MAGYTKEKLEGIAARLAALPAKEAPPRELSKKEAVSFLRKEIDALRKRGYSLEHIGEALRGEGLEIGDSTLKSYLKKAQRKPTELDKGAAKGKPKGTSLGTKTPNRAIPAGTKAGSDSEQQKRAGTFAIRPDKEDM